MITEGLKTRIGRLIESLRSYHFEFRHLTILFIVLIVFQLIASFLQRNSIRNFLTETQNWYQQDSAERLANLTATSLELLLESKVRKEALDDADARRMIQGLNIIFSQQLLHQNVQEVCLLVDQKSGVLVLADGQAVYASLVERRQGVPSAEHLHTAAVRLYAGLRDSIRRTEQIRTIVEEGQTFHTFVPFVPRGEYVGAVYMRITPDFGTMTRDLAANYGQTAGTYLALILFGLIAMYYISSYTLRERNEAQHLLFEQQKEHLTEQINVRNELLFTKRIYHTHHKAEKIMGFIKEDLRHLSAENTEAVRERITKYSNFIARVIYDMKWYEPPLQTIRGPIFNTDINDVIRFIVENIFQRVVRKDEGLRFDLHLDPALPSVPLNEFVVWEVLEPMIQNSLDHAGQENTVVSIRTAYDRALQSGTIVISDRGKGIEPWLLERDANGVRRIFGENTTTKRTGTRQNSGYGCYLAYEIARQRCGWDLDAVNAPEGGARFTITFTAG